MDEYFKVAGFAIGCALSLALSCFIILREWSKLFTAMTSLARESRRTELRLELTSSLFEDLMDDLSTCDSLVDFEDVRDMWDHKRQCITRLLAGFDDEIGERTCD